MQQCQAATQSVFILLLAGLFRSRAPCQMKAQLRTHLVHKRQHGSFIAQVAEDDLHFRSKTYLLPVRLDEREDILPEGEQQLSQARANESGSAGDEDALARQLRLARAEGS